MKPANIVDLLPVRAVLDRPVAVVVAKAMAADTPVEVATADEFAPDCCSSTRPVLVTLDKADMRSG
jgi:hypothetical protein